ncbi:hypothetical protein G7046_g7537 [Stylonectria norvegica]|nr:hypothetical protein G7046_g7537 [Stylonectria norvegica]
MMKHYASFVSRHHASSPQALSLSPSRVPASYTAPRGSTTPRYGRLAQQQRGLSTWSAFDGVRYFVDGADKPLERVCVTSHLPVSIPRSVHAALSVAGYPDPPVLLSAWPGGAQRFPEHPYLSLVVSVSASVSCLCLVSISSPTSTSSLLVRVPRGTDARAGLRCPSSLPNLSVSLPAIFAIMTGAIATPRYSADDFETASVRSAAPSYSELLDVYHVFAGRRVTPEISEVPSYHSTAPFNEGVPSLPAYSPQATRTTTSANLSSQTRSGTATPRQQTIGLPPIPSIPSRSVPNLNNFRIATWSTTTSNPTARHYHSVAQRRVTAQREPSDSIIRRVTTEPSIEQQQEESIANASRPLEDPYLVGEEAAARARRERLARESGDDILIREDRQWDWFLASMKDWDERERSWKNFRREVDMSHRKKLLRRIGGRRLM